MTGQSYRLEARRATRGRHRGPPAQRGEGRATARASLRRPSRSAKRFAPTMNDIPTFESSATSGLDQLLRTVGAPDVPRPVALADEMMQVFLNPSCDLDRATLEYFRSARTWRRPSPA